MDCHKLLCRGLFEWQRSTDKEAQASGVAIFEIIGFRLYEPVGSDGLQVNGIQGVLGSILRANELQNKRI